MNKIQMAAQLYDTRDTMRRFFGDEYPGKVSKYRPYLEAETQNHGGKVLPAMISLVEKLQSNGDGNEIAMAMMMATAVEMIECQG